MSKLVACIDGGLVNKMLAYMSTKVVSSHLKKDLYIYWTPHLEGLCENLFILFPDDNTNVISGSEYFNNYLKNEEIIYSKDDFQNIEDIALIDYNKNIVLKEYVLELKPKFLPFDYYHGEMTKVWKGLKINQRILDMVPAVDSNTITIHIRKYHIHINISMNTYENIIKEELQQDPDVKFFITSDNLEDKNYLINKFPDACFSNDIKTYWNVKNEAGVIDAFLDILTINQTRKIYTPAGSTFTYLSRYHNENIKSIHIPNDK